MAHEKREIWVAAQTDEFGDTTGLGVLAATAEEAKAAAEAAVLAAYEKGENETLAFSWKQLDESGQWTGFFYVLWTPDLGGEMPTDEELEAENYELRVQVWKAGEI